MEERTIETLRKLGQDDWDRLVAELSAEMHPVDRGAVAIWFSFWPLKLCDALESAENPDDLVREWRLTGNYRLSEQLDQSVEFLFGARWWPQVKKAVLESLETGEPSQEVGRRVRLTAKQLASSLGVPLNLLTGITTVAWMALRQVGRDCFAKASAVSGRTTGSSPDKIVKARRRQSGQGLLGFLKGINRRHKVIFDQKRRSGYFEAIEGQDLSMASRSDTRDYQSEDPRRAEGPIPFECRSASCGFCWIGILGGRDRLAQPGRLERKQLRYFGYVSAHNRQLDHPLIRLACQSACHGDVTVVIPPWNGKLNGRV